MPRCVVLGVLLWGAAALSAGGALSAQDSPPAPASCMTPSDPQGPIALPPGQEFSVVLDANPTTGFSWLVGGLNASVVRFAGSRFMGPPVARPGAPGTQCLTFVAVRDGRTAIALDYRRIFAVGVAPARTQTLEVIVGGGGLSSVTGAGAWTAAGAMTTPRTAALAALLADGRVLVADGGNFGALTSSELYDPATGTWTATGDLSTARLSATATTLLDGRVLAAGGQGPVGMTHILTSTDLYDPTSGTWSAGPDMTTARIRHTATLLVDGRVLVAGGTGDAAATAELFDPTAGAWRATGSLTTPRWGHTATLLADGRVLVAGGFDADGNATATAELYQPANGMWTRVAGMSVARVGHSATLLPDGKVLVAGGTGDAAATAELFDPLTLRWSGTGGLLAPRGNHTATLLVDGRVLVVGGQAPGQDGVYLAATELYDPTAGAWTAGPDLSPGRASQTATLLRDGRVLVAGGSLSPPGGNLAAADLYTPGGDG
jgi:predicted secreted protein